jgi:hypothetical protein
MTAKTLPAATRAEVYQAIDGERAYQKKWENPDLTDSGGRHSNVEFLVYIRDYVEEALHAATRKPDPAAVADCTNGLRKIAALAVAAMEQNGVLHRPGSPASGGADGG